MPLTFPRDCLDVDADQSAECSGPARYRMTLSTRGPRVPLCDLHWAHRLQQLDKSNEVYPSLCPPGVWSLVAPAQVVKCIVEDVLNWPAHQTIIKPEETYLAERYGRLRPSTGSPST